MFKQALANAKLLIVILTVLLLLSLTSNIWLGKWLGEAATHPVVHIDGAIPEAGVNIKAGTISNHAVYSFTLYIWSGLQTWLTNGKTDLTKKLTQYAPYLTNDFYNQMTGYGESLDRQGLLEGHLQSLVNADSNVYSPHDVKRLSDGVWLVHLTMRLVNRVSGLDHPQSFAKALVTQDATLSYVFKVIETTSAIPHNHWSLQISGFAAPPKKLKVYTT